MFCRYCGNDIAGDSIFCAVCGKRLKEEPVSQAPVAEQPVQYDTNSPLYYYNNTEDGTKPMNREYHPSKYERMSGFSGSLNNGESESAMEIEYKRAPEEPIETKKKKSSIVPYILLPVGYLVSSVLATVCQMLFGNVYHSIIRSDVFDSDFMFSYLYSAIYSLASGLSYVIPYVITIILFSLCCKGIYKKAMFVGSTYVGQLGGFVSSVISVIIGYFILFIQGFHTFESQSTYTTATAVCNIINIVIFPVLAFLFFLWSQKYTIRKEEKARAVNLVVPGILLAFYGVLDLGLQLLANFVLQPALDDLFNGDYTFTFASNVAHLITTSVSLVCLFLMALACKGGYRKVAFIGSFKFAIAICGFLPNLVAIIGTMIDESWYKGSLCTGAVIQYLCAIPVAIIIYSLLNRYVVEKVKKKA